MARDPLFSRVGRQSTDIDASGSLADRFGDANDEDAVVEGGHDRFVVDVAGQDHLVLESPDGALSAAQDPDALFLFAFASHSEPATGDLDVEVLLADPWQFDVDDVGVVGLFDVGRSVCRALQGGVVAMPHVRRARSGGGWDARYRDPSGRERSHTFKTKRDAELFLGRQSADIQRGDYLDPDAARTPFERWAHEWLATTVHLKPKTRAAYESILRHRVLPAFGARPIGGIQQIEVRRFAAALAHDGAQPGTIRNTFNVVRLVFGAAVSSGAIRANPCTGVRMPRSTRTQMLYLAPGEILDLAEAIEARFRLLILTAAFTGMRAGELGALRVGRIDLTTGTLEVRESLSEVNGQLSFGPTKTYSQRTLRLPTFLRDGLADHMASHPNGRDDLVFTGTRGAPLRHNLFYTRHFKPAVRRAGLPDRLRFHDLRHTCAALLIAQGAHPKAIMERLGHSSIQVTLDRYGHLLPTLDQALTVGLEATYQAALGERDRRTEFENRGACAAPREPVVHREIPRRRGIFAGSVDDTDTSKV